MYFGVSMIFLRQLYFVEIDDVGVTHELNDVQLSVYSFAVGKVKYFGFLEPFYCDMFTGWNMSCFSYNPKSSSANDLA